MGIGRMLAEVPSGIACLALAVVDGILALLVVGMQQALGVEEQQQEGEC